MVNELSVVRTCSVVASVLILGGCGPTKLTTAASPVIDKYRIESVVVMPFERLTTPQILDPLAPEFSVPRGAQRSDISVMIPPPSPEKLDQTTSTVPTTVPEKISQMVYRKIQKRRGVRALPPDEAVRAIKKLPLSWSTAPVDEIAAAVATQLGVDAALTGRVLVYRERVGSKWGADPAVVGFEVKLIGPDGVALWTANYYEKQRPMIEDLAGFLERGPVFVTADELAEYGTDRIVRKFPFGQP